MRKEDEIRNTLDLIDIANTELIRLEHQADSQRDFKTSISYREKRLTNYTKINTLRWVLGERKDGP